MRSGWNCSKASSFSPVEAKAIGRPMTSLTDSAAPPRASPSSLERITPSIDKRLVEPLGDLDRVLAGHRVDHEERVVRLDGSRDLADLLHHLFVDGQAAGGVDDQHVAAEPAGFLQAPLRGA